MLIAANITESMHLAALRAAREIGKNEPLSPGVLNAPLDNAAMTWVNKIWDVAEAAIKNAVRDGVAAAQPMIDRVGSMLNEAAESVGTHMAAVRDWLKKRLDAYLKAAVDDALMEVRPYVTIGGAMLKLSKVTLEQKLTLSGSVSASLEQICEFVAEGEVTLATEYGAGD